MRKIILQSFITLDGVMQSPGGPYEDPTGKFSYGGWAVNYFDESMMKFVSKSTSQPFELLLGRRTYEIFAAHWPFVNEKHKKNPKENTLDDPFANTMNSVKKYVVSHVPLVLPWNNTKLLSGDTVEEIRKIKETDGPEIQVHGSGNMIQTLLKNDLVDEIRLMMFPITLGKGKKLFDEGTRPSAFKLTSSGTSSTGVYMAIYEKSGVVQMGTAEFDTPTKAELDRRRSLKTKKKVRNSLAHEPIELNKYNDLYSDSRL
jgi:dihydrofolate reductase